MLISIVTIVRNDRTGFARTRNSVHSQNFRDFEWVVVDGASTDGTAEDVLEIDLPHAQVSSESDNGIFDAMNKGLNVSRGQFVLFLNAGDVFPDSSTLDLVSSKLLVQNVDFLYGDSLEKFAGKVPIYKPARSYRRAYYGMFACHQTMYYRRLTIGDVRFNTNLKIAGDYDFTTRFLNKTSKIEKLSAALCVFDLTGASTQHRQQGRRENWVIQRDVLNLSFGSRLCIRLCYLTMSFCNRYLPNIYKNVRFRVSHD